MADNRNCAREGGGGKGNVADVAQQNWGSGGNRSAPELADSWGQLL